MAYDVKIKSFEKLADEELQELIWEYMNKGYKVQKAEIKFYEEGLNGVYAFIKEFEDVEEYIEFLKKENEEYEDIIKSLIQEEEVCFEDNKYAQRYWKRRIEHNIKKMNLLKEKEE